MAVSKRLRFEILKRDSNACRYCGACAPEAKLTIDHVTPTALGGSDAPDNLVTACADCNSGKTSTTPDAPLVAQVAGDALRWAAAIKEAAAEMAAEDGPKLTYREAFISAWSEWNYEYNGEQRQHDLPDDWRGSVERYRLAGIPITAWPDLIEPGMINRQVKSRDIFRYTCGVANTKLRKLADRAKQLVGADNPQPNGTQQETSVLHDAACAIWCHGMGDGEDAPSAEDTEAFRRSLGELSVFDATDVPRVIEAAQHATYFGLTNINEAIRDMDRHNIWQAWITAWPTTYEPGDPDEPFSGRSIGGPSEKVKDHIREQIEKILDADVGQYRAVQAATYAGFHRSGRIYRGLAEQDLDATGESSGMATFYETWAKAFEASAIRRPTQDELNELSKNLSRILHDEDLYFADLWVAAASAGAYQDVDPSTCMTRHLSVFEMAAQPLQFANPGT